MEPRRPLLMIATFVACSVVAIIVSFRSKEVPTKMTKEALGKNLQIKLDDSWQITKVKPYREGLEGTYFLKGRTDPGWKQSADNWAEVETRNSAILDDMHAEFGSLSLISKATIATYGERNGYQYKVILVNADGNEYVEIEIVQLHVR